MPLYLVLFVLFVINKEFREIYKISLDIDIFWLLGPGFFLGQFMDPLLQLAPIDLDPAAPVRKWDIAAAPNENL
jgi:hypothetical protein